MNVRVFSNILKTRPTDNYLIELREGLRANSSLTVFKRSGCFYNLSFVLNAMLADYMILLWVGRDCPSHLQSDRSSIINEVRKMKSNYFEILSTSMVTQGSNTVFHYSSVLFFTLKVV